MGYQKDSLRSDVTKNRKKRDWPYERKRSPSKSSLHREKLSRLIPRATKERGERSTKNGNVGKRVGGVDIVTDGQSSDEDSLRKKRDGLLGRGWGQKKCPRREQAENKDQKQKENHKRNRRCWGGG